MFSDFYTIHSIEVEKSEAEKNQEPEQLSMLTTYIVIWFLNAYADTGSSPTHGLSSADRVALWVWWKLHKNLQLFHGWSQWLWPQWGIPITQPCLSQYERLQMDLRLSHISQCCGIDRLQGRSLHMIAQPKIYRAQYQTPWSENFRAHDRMNGFYIAETTWMYKRIALVVISSSFLIMSNCSSREFSCSNWSNTSSVFWLARGLEESYRVCKFKLWYLDPFCLWADEEVDDWKYFIGELKNSLQDLNLLQGETALARDCDHNDRVTVAPSSPLIRNMVLAPLRFRF